MNSIILCGRLTRNPEGATTQSGHAYAKFTLAVDRIKGEPDFIDCIAWDKTAELVDKYLTKGRQCLVQGALQIDTYQAKDGTKRNRAVVRCDRVEFVGGNGNTAQNRNDGVKDGNDIQLTPVDVSQEEIPF